MFVDSGAYERFMGRWSAKMAPHLVAFAGVRDGDVVLDVGCGTGSLSTAAVSVDPTGTVLGVDPSEAFVKHARAAEPAARFEVGDAQRLQFHDDTFDCVLSLFVLNFVPDRDAAAREMQRVARPGATVAVAVWDYQGGLPMLSRFWEEAVALDPGVEGQDEKHMPLCREGALEELWRAHGFLDVLEQPIAIEQSFASFDDYWLPFLHGVGPAGAYVATLDGERRDTLREQLRRRLAGDGGEFTLPARAWAVRGTVP